MVAARASRAMQRVRPMRRDRTAARRVVGSDFGDLGVYSSGGPRPVQLNETAAMEVSGTRSITTIERRSTGARTACALCASGAPLKARTWHSGQVALLSPRVRLAALSMTSDAVDGCAKP